MASVLKIMRPALALLLLAALLAAGKYPDWVTTAECKASYVWEMSRVRLYPTDSIAAVLSMSNCGLTEIKPDTFTGLPKLQVVYLNNNNIEILNTAVFRAVPTLTNLYLYNNKLRELPVFDQHSCPNLTDLQVSYNQLTGIFNAGTFSSCTKLETLDLHNNNIEFIHFKAFSGLTELRTLYLYNNKIRFIPDQMFSSNSKLDLLNINNNSITHLAPEFASSLTRAGAGFVEFYFHDNPWHCVCLLDLLADVKRAGLRYYQRWSYDGARPMCNYLSMREYPCRKIRELSFIVHGVR